jgi:F-type H+-transporting ATPase subunit a
MFEIAKLGSWLPLAAAAEHGGKEGEKGHAGLTPIGLAVYAAIVIIAAFVLMAQAKKGFTPRYFTTKLAQMFEHLYLFLENMAVSIVGAHGRKYLPMLFTFWIIIFLANVLSLFAPTAPTADISFNLGMAFIVFCYVQWEGMKANGVLGHLRHFAGPKLPIALILINVLIFVVELISEIMKNVSLTLRLYGNIDGGHRASDALSTMGKHIGGTDLSIPFGSFLMPVKLMTCLVQAMIFVLLACVYLGLVTHHEHDDDDHGDHGHDPAHAHA